MRNVAIVRILMLAGCLVMLSSAGQADTVSKDLVMGVVPQRAASVLAVEWAPFLAYLSQQSGKNIKFASAPDIETFDRRTAAGEFDLVYMNPMYYTVVHEKVGYQAFAKEKEVWLKALIVVRKDSPHKTLADLAGLMVDFPGPIAFAATILPLAQFKQLGVSVTPVYAGSHETVYNDVARGLYAAGGGIERTLNQIDPNVRNELRILWNSESYTPHPFAAHPRVDNATVESIQKAMLDLGRDVQGSALLKEIRFRGFVAASNAEYDQLKVFADQR